MRDSEALLRLIFEAARRAGVSADALSQRMGCPPDLLTDPSGRYPHELQPYFWAALEQVSEDDEIGLSLCRHLPGFDGHRLEYVLLSSPTLRDGLLFARRHRRILSDAMQLDVCERSPHGTHIALSATTYDAPERRHTEICATFAIARALRTVPLGAGAVTGVHLSVAPRRAAADYAAVFGCPVTFGEAPNRITLQPAALDARLPLANPDIAAVHRDLVSRQSEPIGRQDVIDQIRAELYHRCVSGYGVTARLPEMAAVIGLSERRIRQALAEMGTSFRTLLSDTRVRVAERLLVETDAPLDYIARVAGFADGTALSRAFASAHGSPPLRYRRHCRRGPARHRTRSPDSVLTELSRKAARRLSAIAALD